MNKNHFEKRYKSVIEKLLTVVTNDTLQVVEHVNTDSSIDWDKIYAYISEAVDLQSEFKNCILQHYSILLRQGSILLLHRQEHWQEDYRG